MDHLLRDLAPIPDDAWSQIDSEAKTRLSTYLAARRLVDFTGPFGWEHSSYNLGQVAPAGESPGEGVDAGIRQVQPLVELRASFTVSVDELANAARGDSAIDLGSLDRAARALASAENLAVLHGYEAGSIQGITEASSHLPLDFEGWAAFPKVVATGVERLQLAGIGGPYGLALGSEAWIGVVEYSEHGGYPLLDHLGRVLGGPILPVAGVAGGVIVSQRGGDFTFVSGQDLAIGYRAHDAEAVTLYLEESFSFRVQEPDAAVAIQI